MPGPAHHYRAGVTTMTTPQDSDSDRIERIERIVERVASDVEKIAHGQADLKADISTLQRDMGVMQRDVSALKHDMGVMQRDVSALQRDMGALQRDVSALQRDMGALKHDMGVMQRDVSALQRDMGALQRDMGVMKGWQTELAVERRARAIFRRLCGGRLLRVYPDGELQHYIGYHRHAGAMSEDEFSRAGTADFLLEGTDSHGAAVMYAVEVSYTVGTDDIGRAIDKAALLSRALGREVSPAVVGEAATAHFEADAAHRNVAYAFVGNGRDILR